MKYNWEIGKEYKLQSGSGARKLVAICSDGKLIVEGNFSNLSYREADGTYPLAPYCSLVYDGATGEERELAARVCEIFGYLATADTLRKWGTGGEKINMKMREEIIALIREIRGGVK